MSRVLMVPPLRCAYGCSAFVAPFVGVSGIVAARCCGALCLVSLCFVSLCFVLTVAYPPLYDVPSLHPDYFKTLVNEKVLSVHQELGYNLMVIIITTVLITFVSTLLLLSISRRGDKPKHWAERFSAVGELGTIRTCRLSWLALVSRMGRASTSLWAQSPSSTSCRCSTSTTSARSRTV